MSALSLIIGIIIGAVAASLAWFVVGAGNKKKLDERKRAKEEVMSAIGELLADADAHEASYRCGAITESGFIRGLIDKVNAISRPLRTNMHILDVFFVKYAEQQVDEYMRMIENPERRAEARKAIRASLLEEGRERSDTETRLGIQSIAVTPIAEQRETDAITIEGPDIFDAGIDSREKAFAPPPSVGVGAEEDAFELPETESPEEPESVLEDAAAEAPPEEQVFGESPASAATDDSWAAEKSLEEFEAEFAQFEPQEATEEPKTPEPKSLGEFVAGFDRFEAQKTPAEEPAAPEEAEAEAEQSEHPAEFGRETGDFLVGGQAGTPESELEPEPEQELVLEDEEEDIFDIEAPPPADSEHAETMEFDKSAVLEDELPLTKPQAEAGEPKPAAEHDGITGDDVSDAIDNFFKIK